MALNDFVNRWEGKRVDIDNYPEGAIYQCTDLTTVYLNEVFGLPIGAYGDAIEYWIKTKPSVLAKFDKVTDKSIRPGDIVIIDTAGTSPEHIGVGLEGSQILEQNGQTGNGQGKGGDAIRKRKIDPSKVIGILRPKGGNDVYLTPAEYEDYKKWKEIGLDAAPYKDAVVRSKAWKTDMKSNGTLVLPVIDDLYTFKQDTLTKPSKFKKYDGATLYVEDK